MSAPVRSEARGDDWMAVLRREAERTSIAEVARRLGYSRPAISLVVHGRYPATRERIAARVREVFGADAECPHLRAPISPEDCAAVRTAPMPTNDPKRLRHWTACRACPLNPDQKRSA